LRKKLLQSRADESARRHHADRWLCNKETEMKSIFKSAIVVAAMASATALVPGAATAGVTIGIGLPAVVVAPSPGYVPYDEQYYYEPIYISGSWYHGPYRWRMRGGERVFFVDGRWQRNEWREGRIPASIVFRNGGELRGGRYEGFEGAERINARFHPGNSDVREDRRELSGDKADMRQDRGDVREDRKDLHSDRRDAGHDGDKDPR
jgi:hypothetical protein